ncbi:MAG TPA: ribosome maturation factor RimM [Dehalococcoidia bacterium]|nr:ribosome maturation factor RimM [Dehalococcoidia bacterium]
MAERGPAPPDDVREGFVAVGRVARPFGLEGELLVDPLAEPEVLAPGRYVFLAGRRHRVLSCRWQRGRVLLRLEGIEDRTAAEAYRFHYLELPQEELEPLGEGEYYYFQLVGLEAVTSSGERLGTVRRVMETGGGNQVLVVRGERGEVLLPAVEEFVRVDLEAGRIVVEDVPGLLPDTR